MASAATRQWVRRPPPVRATNLALLVGLVVVLFTGLGSWAAGEPRAGWVVVAHGIAGLALLALVPWKARLSTRGWRRARRDRWVSALLAAAVVAALVTGYLHAGGIVVDIGDRQVMWWHLAAGFAAVLPAAWHVLARPVRPRVTDLSRRNGLRVAAAGALGGAAWLATEGAVRVLGTRGARRRFTGSYELASFRPARMPQMIWLADHAPDVGDGWDVTVTTTGGAARHTLADLAARPPTTVRAALDCTGGWYAWQDWRGVPLRDLVGEPEPEARSLTVTSRTGYWVRFDVADLDDLLLAHAYGEEALRRGHGGPLRLVARGSRGYRWVKWVERIELSAAPAWWQPPFPAR